VVPVGYPVRSHIKNTKTEATAGTAAIGRSPSQRAPYEERMPAPQRDWHPSQ
jgi:hypothetical protein